MDTINNDKPNDAKDEAQTAGSPVEESASETTEAPAAGTGPEAAVATAGTDSADSADLDADVDEEAAEAELAQLNAARSATGGVLAGAAALVGLGLALASVTGTWIGTLMQQREQLIGQISSGSGATPAKQLVAEFGTPWHATALFNGLFGLVAILVAVAVLIGQSITLAPPAAPWVRAVTWAALVLGIIGLVIAGVMYLDIFTHLPSLPATTAPSTGGATG